MKSADSGKQGPSRPISPDPHGAAALTLVESLLHFLIERSVLAHADALEVVQIATGVQIEISAERGDDLGVCAEAVRLLCAIGASLETDAP